MKNLVIIGAGETARLAYEYFTHDSDYSVIAFAVEKEFHTKSSFCDVPLINFDDFYNHYMPDQSEVFIAMGSGELNRVRTRFYNLFKGKGYKCASYISSKAFKWHDVEIGDNCFILENNVLQSGVKIGNNVTLWSGNHIGHLSTIDDHCFIASHVVISGSCSVGTSCFIGVNVTVADNIHIGNDNFIGMASIIAKNTDDDALLKPTATISSGKSAKRIFRVKDEA